MNCTNCYSIAADSKSQGRSTYLDWYVMVECLDSEINLELAVRILLVHGEPTYLLGHCILA